MSCNTWKKKYLYTKHSPFLFFFFNLIKKVVRNKRNLSRKRKSKFDVAVAYPRRHRNYVFAVETADTGNTATLDRAIRRIAEGKWGERGKNEGGEV